MSALADYLERNKIKGIDFAQRLTARGLPVTPSRISQICGGALPSLALAVAIERETAGAVRPADHGRRDMAPAVRKTARRRA